MKISSVTFILCILKSVASFSVAISTFSLYMMNAQNGINCTLLRCVYERAVSE